MNLREGMEDYGREDPLAVTGPFKLVTRGASRNVAPILEEQILLLEVQQSWQFGKDSAGPGEVSSLDDVLDDGPATIFRGSAAQTRMGSVAP